MRFEFLGARADKPANREQRRRLAKQRRGAALVFEALEPRVLLSADPLSVALSGDATHPMAHDVIIQQVTQHLSESDHTTVQMVQVVDQAGPTPQVLASAPLADVSAIDISSVAGNTSLTVDTASFAGDAPPQITFAGGAGVNTLTVSGDAATSFDITGANAGTVSGPTTIAFTGVANLTGGNGATEFMVERGGSLSGVLDGGPGVDGTLMFNNYSATNAVFTGSGPHSGAVSLDRLVFTYADLSPIVYSGTAANVVITATGEIALGDSSTPGEIQASSLDQSMESLTFSVPTKSLTVNLTGGSDSLAISNLHLDGASLTATGTGADSITIGAGDTVSTRVASSDAIGAPSSGNSGNLSLTAASLTVEAGANVLANANSGFQAGSISLQATSSGTNADATAMVEGGTIVGGSVAVDANASANQTIAQTGAATLQLTADASALVGGASSIDATTGSIDIGATVSAGGKVTVKAAPGGSLTSDAAVAVSDVSAAANVQVDDTTVLDADDAVSVHSRNTTTVQTIADGAPASVGTVGVSALGGVVAVSEVDTSSSAVLGGVSGSPSAVGDVTVTAHEVSLTANSVTHTTTMATATRGGATANGPVGQAVLAGGADTPDGAVTVAAAIAGAAVSDGATAEMGAAGVSAPEGLDVTAGATRQVVTTADASPVHDAGVGAAVAMNQIGAATTAELAGAPTIAGAVVLVAEPSDGPDVFGAAATSGAGGTAPGVAGALAINGVTDTSFGGLAAGANVTMPSGDLTVSVDQSAEAATGALAFVSGDSTTIGVGASVAVAPVTFSAEAGAEAGSVLNVGTQGGPETDARFAVDATRAVDTVADGGVNGGGGTAAALALTVAEDSASAELDSGASATVQGNLDLGARQASDVQTTSQAEAGATASVVAFGVVLDQTQATTSAEVQTSGAVTLTASGATSSTTLATAAPGGAAANGPAAPAVIAAELQYLDDPSAMFSPPSGAQPVVTPINPGVVSVQPFGGALGPTVPSRPNGGALPAAADADGAFGVAGALALGVAIGRVAATIEPAVGMPETVTASDISQNAYGGTNATTRADGSGVGSTGVGAALALQLGQAQVLAEDEAPIDAPVVSLTASGPQGDTRQPAPAGSFDVQALSGAGATGVGVAGALAIAADSVNIQALLDGAATATGSVTLSASGKSQSAVDASATGATGKVGVGASVAVDVSDVNVAASIGAGGSVSGNPSLTISASGGQTAKTTAEGGAEGGVATGAALALAVVTDEIAAGVASGATANVSQANIDASGGGAATTTATGGAAAGVTAIGPSLGLGILIDNVSARVDGDLTANGAVTLTAAGANGETTTADAGARGASSAGASVVALLAAELGFLDDPGGVAIPALNTGAGALGVAAALAVGVDAGTVEADVGGQASAGGALTITATGDSSANSAASGAAVGSGLRGEGIAAAAAITVATPFVQARVDGSATGAGVTLTAGPATSNGDAFGATAKSGAGAGATGVAGAFALLVAAPVTEAAIGGAGVVNAAGDAVELTATGASSETSTAAAANLGAGKFGLGASVAIDVAADDTHARLEQGASVADTDNLILNAAGAYNSSAVALAGSQSSGLDGAIAVDVAPQDTKAEINSGAALSLTGNLQLTATQTQSSASLAFGGLPGQRGEFGAAIAVNAPLPTTDAALDRGVAAAGAIEVQATSSDTAASDATAAAGGTDSANSADNDFAGWLDAAAADGSVAAPAVPSIATSLSNAGSKLGLPLPEIGGAAALAVGAADSNTDAGIAAGAPVTATRAVTVLATGSSQAGATADASAVDDDVAAGLGFAVNYDSQNIDASVAGGTAVKAAALTVDAAVTGGQAQTATVKAMAGAGADAGIAGAIALNLVNNSTDAEIDGTSSAVAPDWIIINALGNTSSTATAGEAAHGDVVGSGVALAGNLDVDVTDATVGAGANLNSPGAIDIAATGAQTVETLAAGAADGGLGAVPASLTADVLLANTAASIGDGAGIDTATPDAPAMQIVSVTSSDTTALTAAAGSLGIAGLAGTGAAGQFSDIVKQTTADIDGVVDSAGDVIVRATSSETGLTAADAGALSAVVSVAGGAGVQLGDLLTQAEIGGDASVHAVGDVVVTALDTTEMETMEGAANASFDASAGAGVGAIGLQKTTEALVANGAIVDADGQGAGTSAPTGFNVTFSSSSPGPDMVAKPFLPSTLTSIFGILLNNPIHNLLSPVESIPTDSFSSQYRVATPVDTTIHGLAVTALSHDDLAIDTAGLGASGLAALELSASGIAAQSTTEAEIGADAKINQRGFTPSARQSVLVDAEGDGQAMAIAGALPVGGLAAVGPAAGLIAMDPVTEAFIGAGATVSSNDDLTVEAQNQTDLLTDATGVSASNIGVSGSAGATVLGGHTYAYIDANANVVAQGSVQVYALDTSTVQNVAGALSGSNLIGGGGSAAVNIVGKDTEAWIGAGAHVTARDATPDFVLAINPDPTALISILPAQGVSVLADSQELVMNLVANGAGGGGAAFIGGGAGVIMGNVTAAFVADGAVVTAGQFDSRGNPVRDSNPAEVSVGALDQTNTWDGVASLVDATVALSGAADAGVIRNQTAASVDEGAIVDATGDIDVAARSSETVNSFVGGLGGSQDGVALNVSASVYSIGAVVPGDLLDPLASVSGPGSLESYLDGLLQGMVGAANNGIVGVLNRYAGAVGGSQAAASQLAALTPASPVTGAFTATSAGKAGTTATVTGATLSAHGAVEVTADDAVTPNLDTSFTFAISSGEGVSLALDGGLLAGRANATASVAGGSRINAVGDIDVLADASTTQNVNSTFAFNNSTGNASALVDGSMLRSGGAVNVESDMDGSNKYSGILPGISGLKARTSENKEANTSIASVSDNSDVTASGALTVQATTNSTNKVIADGATLFGDGFDGAFTLGVALAWNNIGDTTTATISGSQTQTKSVAVKALATTDDTTVALGVADGSNDPVAIGGSASRNILADTVSATIEHSTVVAPDGVDVNADDAITLLAISGGAVARSSFGVTGAASVNTTTDAVTAEIGSSIVDVSGSAGIEIVADGKASMSALAAAAGQSKNVIGASLPIDTLDMNINADADASTLTTAGNVKVQATGDGEIKALAGSVAVATSQVGVGAAVAVSNAGETVSASIASSTVNAGGGVTVAADATPEIEALALGLAYAPTVAAGGSVAIDNVNDVVKAAIIGAAGSPSTITAGGDIDVDLKDAPTIKTLTGAAAVSSGQVGLAGSVSTDNVGDADTMTVDNASLRTPTGSILLQGTIKPNILAIAIAGAADTGFTAAGAVAKNNVSSTLDETVGKTTAILSAPTVSVTGEDDSTIKAVTAGLDGSSTATVAGSVSINNISGGMTVELAHGGVIDATTATVGATDNATIETLAGAVNGAGTYSGGASVATNTIGNATTAEDVGGQINARTVNVNAVGKGTIEALAAMGGGAGTVATDAAVTTNTIDAGILAAVLSGAMIDVGGRGTLSVTATSDNTIKSLAGALSGAGAVDVQGAVAYNNIATRATTPDGANAEVEDSTITGGSATVKAENDDQITSAAVGAGGAGTVALGASVAYNTATAIANAEVDDDTIELTGSLTVNANNDSGIGSGSGGAAGAGTVAGGAAVSINHIVDDVDAEISGGAVAARDGVGVDADDNASIETLSAIGTGAGTVALDASVSINTIGGTILGAITGGASVTSDGAVSVNADSDSTIKSLSGAVSGAGIVGGGAAIALNRIGDTSDESSADAVGTIEKALNHPKSDPAATPPAASTTASIDSGSTVHAGSVSVDAKFTGEVKSAAVGGAAAGTVALEGAVTDNLIGDQVMATILGSTTKVQTVHDIDLAATNDAKIDSLAGALAGAGIASGGAAVAVNKLTGSADAIVKGATATSTQGGVSLTGAGGGDVTSIAIAGAIAATVALSAAVTVNDVGNTIEAEAEKGASLSAAQDIALNATDGGTIESNADDVDGALVAASGAVATNDIADQISARADRSTLTSNSGEIKLEATDSAGIETLSAALTGGFVAVNGTVSSNEIGDILKAVINDSTVTGPLGVFVQAVDSGGIKSAAANLTAGAAGVGGAAAYNQIENTVAAAIEGGATVSASFGNVMVQSDEQATVQTLAAGGAFGVAGIGGSVSVSIIANNVSSDVSKSTVNAFGNLGVIADDDDSIQAWGGEIAGGVVGVGASVSVLTLESTTQAYIDASKVAALGDTPPILAIGISPSTGAATAGDARGVVVDARDMENANVKALTIAAGLVAIPANVADIHSAATTDAFITGSQVNSAADPGAGVFVHATQATTVDGTLGVGGLGLAVIGADIEIATIDNVTNAYIADDVGSGAPTPSAVYADDILVSTTTYEKASATTIGVAVGLVAVGGTVAYDNIDSASGAFVRNSLLDARNGQASISVVALDNANIGTDDKNVAAGLVGAGAAVDVSTIGDTTQAQLIGATLNANGAIEVEANSTGSIDDGASGAGAGLVGIAATVLVDHINSLTEADTQSDGSIATAINQDPSFAGKSNGAGGNTQSVSIVAAGNATVDGSSGVIAGGLLGGGAAIHVGGIDDQVDATVGAGTLINAAGNISVTANDIRNLSSDAFAGSAGLVALGGAFSILSIGGSFDPGTLAAIDANQSSNGSQLASEPNSYIDQIKPGSMIHASDSPVAANWLKHDNQALPKVANPLANTTAVSGIFASVGGSKAGAAPKLTAGGNITVTATNTYSVSASAGAVVGGLVSLGIGVAYTDITDTVSARTGEGATLSAGGVIRVAAHDTTSKKTGVSATDGQGGVVSVGGALAHTTLKLAVDATMTPSTKVENAGAVVISANQSADLGTNGDNAQVGLLAAGVVKSSTNISGSVSAGVGNGVVIGAKAPVGSLTVSTSSENVGATKTTADAYGIVAGDGSSASTDIDPNVSAVFGDSAAAFASGDATIESTSSGASSATADGTEIAAGALGLSSATARFAPLSSAIVGSNALLDVGGNVTIEANDLAIGATTATAQSSGGGFISGIGASADATDNGSAQAQVQTDAGIDAGGTLRIFSTAADNSQANVNVTSIGFVAVGGQSSTANANGKSTAELESDTSVTAGALEVDAAGGAEADALSNAAAGGVASGIGSSVTANASPTVIAEILDHTHVDVTGNVDVIAVVMGGASGQANGVDGTVLGEVGESSASVSGAPSVDAAIGAGSVVDAGGNVTVEAASPESKSVSNGSFNAATGVDVSNNSIKFNAPTFAQTGDQVTYETNGGAAIGGLENGRTYNVIRDSATSISLGQQFTGAQVDFATGTIHFAAPDGFQTGDRVVYSSNGGPAIGGLVNGAIYYVRVINPTTIKLAHSLAEAEQTGKVFNLAGIGANGVITLNGNGFGNGEAVTYRTTGAPVAGLADGDVYYVIRLNANQFELAALPGGPALALSEGFATGVQTLGYEGAPIDGIGVAGPQTLTFVLTSAGAGKQRFVGIGGASALLPTLATLPYYHASASGSGGGAFVGAQGMSSTIQLSGSTIAYVGTGATLKAGEDVLVDASSWRDTVDAASSGAYGTGAAAGAYATTTDTETTTAHISSGATITSGQDATIDANGEIAASGEGSSSGGGGVAIGHADVTIQLNPITTTELGDNVGLIARNNLTVNAQESVSGAISDAASDAGLGAGSHANSYFNVGLPGPMPVTVQFGQNDNLSAGGDATISANYALPNVVSRTSSSAAGLGARPTTDDFITVNVPVLVELAAGDKVDGGNAVTLEATYGAVSLESFPDTEKTGIGPQDPEAQVEVDLGALVSAPQGSSIVTHDLTVEAVDGSPFVRAEATEGHSPQTSNDLALVELHRTIAFDAAVTLTSGPAPDLVVDHLGDVVDHAGVHYSIQDGTITVDAIDNVNQGKATFITDAGQSNSYPPQFFPTASTIAGVHASFTFVDTYASVTLQNWSSMNMTVGAIDPIVQTPAAAIKIDADEVSQLRFAVSNVFRGTTIAIGNGDSESIGNLTIAGAITDPIGAATLTALGGAIVAQRGGVVEGASVKLIAGGDIGSTSALLPVEVVESPQAAIGLNAAAGGNLNLSVRARLRDPSVTTFSPQLGSLVAGGNIDLELLSAVSDNVVSGPVYDVTVTQTLPDFGGLTHTITVVNAWPHDGGSPPPLPPGIFAGGSTPINATYNIGLLQASGSISVTDSTSATVGVTAHIATTGPTGDVNVSTNGAVSLTETTGDLRVGAIESTGGAVSLTALNGSILHPSTRTRMPGPAVEGDNITLAAKNGGIGTADDALDIKLEGSGGALTAVAEQGINILDVSGTLALNSVDAGGAIDLSTADGGMTVANGATSPEVVGQTIALTATGGGIATAATPLKVHNTQTNGLTVTSTDTAYVDEVPDALLMEAGLGWTLGNGGAPSGLVNWGAQL